MRGEAQGQERSEILRESAEAGVGAASLLFGVGAGAGVVASVFGHDLFVYTVPFSLLCGAAGVAYFGWLAMESISYPIWLESVRRRQLESYRVWANARIGELEAALDERDERIAKLENTLVVRPAPAPTGAAGNTAKQDALIQAQFDAEAIIAVKAAAQESGKWGGRYGIPGSRRYMERNHGMTQERWSNAVRVLRQAETLDESLQKLVVADDKAVTSLREVVEREVELLRRRSYVSPWF